jgi:hypothetical protein
MSKLCITKVVAAKQPQIGQITMVPSGEEVIRSLARKYDTVSLSFSCGKDSIGAWLALWGKFKRIIPVHFYLVPDLSFVDEALDYYQNAFKTRIYSVPHPGLYKALSSYTLQPPERWSIIDELQLPTATKEEMRALVLEHDTNVKDPTSIYNAIGIRATDGLVRYTTVRKHGVIIERTKTFYPIWDWKKAYLMERLKQSGLRLPADYTMFGRSFDGVHLEYLAPIKEHFPKDYQRILDWFPLANLDLVRRHL